jgi:hypothetical protein
MISRVIAEATIATAIALVAVVSMTSQGLTAGLLRPGAFA